MKALKKIKELKKIFNCAEKEQTYIAKENLNGYMSLDNVLLFIPKTEQVETLIRENFEYVQQKIPKLEYNTIGVSVYSTEYLKKIFSILDLFDDDSVLIKSGIDYPLWLETDTFVIILAPKIAEIKNELK